MNKCFEKIYLIVSPIYILQSNSVQQNIADIIAKEKSFIGLEYFWARLKSAPRPPPSAQAESANSRPV